MQSPLIHGPKKTAGSALLLTDPLLTETRCRAGAFSCAKECTDVKVCVETLAFMGGFGMDKLWSNIAQAFVQMDNKNEHVPSIFARAPTFIRGFGMGSFWSATISNMRSVSLLNGESRT
eukprot:218067-Pelagomonas_calceolata.AAC.1